MPKWIQDQALRTKDECPFTGWGSCLLPSQTWSHTSFLIDSIHSKKKNWTPSIPFQIRLRLTKISRHDSWTWLDLQIRTWSKVQWWDPSHNLGRCRSTYGPTWRLDPSPNDKAFATILELPINGCGRYSEWVGLCGELSRIYQGTYRYQIDYWNITSRPLDYVTSLGMHVHVNEWLMGKNVARILKQSYCH